MRRVFIDTSAILALLVEEDRAHSRARAAFERLKTQEATLLTSSYVLVETYALIGRRHGLEAVRAFREVFAPLLEIVWVDLDLHEEALDLLMDSAREGLSLVDAATAIIVRRGQLDELFAYDRDFEDLGLPTIE